MSLGWGQALIFLFQALRWSECVVSVENLVLCHPGLQNSHSLPLTSLSSLLPLLLLLFFLLPSLLPIPPQSFLVLVKMLMGHGRGTSAGLVFAGKCPL